MHFLTSVDDHLRSGGAFQAKSRVVGTLALGQRGRRVWIFPAIVVPIIHMLAEDNQLCSRNRLEGIPFLEKDIGRRTAGAALRSKQLDEDGMKIRARSLRRRRLFSRGPLLSKERCR